MRNHKYLTNSKVYAIIKGIGRHMTLRVKDGEYRVSFNIEAIMLANNCDYKTALARNEEVAYYTGEPVDAINTAKEMHARYVRTAKI